MSKCPVIHHAVCWECVDCVKSVCRLEKNPTEQGGKTGHIKLHLLQAFTDKNTNLAGWGPSGLAIIRAAKWEEALVPAFLLQKLHSTIFSCPAYIPVLLNSPRITTMQLYASASQSSYQLRSQWPWPLTTKISSVQGNNYTMAKWLVLWMPRVMPLLPHQLGMPRLESCRFSHSKLHAMQQMNKLLFASVSVISWTSTVAQDSP